MARQFNGTNQSLLSATSVDLTGVNHITLSFWLYWDAYASDDDIACELGDPHYLSNGFQVDPNFFDGTFAVGFGASGPTLEWFDTFVRPSAATWFQYIVELNRASPQNLVWINNTSTSLVPFIHNAGSYGNFSNEPLALMSRAGSSLFSAGRMSEFAIYSGALSSGQRAALQTDAPAIVGSPLYYWPIWGTDSPEPNMAGGVNMSLVGTPTYVTDPVSLTGSVWITRLSDSFATNGNLDGQTLDNVHGGSGTRTWQSIFGSPAQFVVQFAKWVVNDHIGGPGSHALAVVDDTGLITTDPERVWATLAYLIDSQCLVLRWSAGSGSYGNCYIMGVGSTSIGFGKFNNGSFTGMASATVTVSPGDTIEFVMHGTTLEAYLNGVLRVTDTDSDHASGLPGIFQFFTSLGPYAFFDNFYYETASVALPHIVDSDVAMSDTSGTSNAVVTLNAVGANRILVCVSTVIDAVASVSDDESNTYTALTRHHNGSTLQDQQWWVCQTPTVSSSLTITASPAGAFRATSIVGIAVADCHPASAFDQQNGYVDGGSTVQPGLITPTEDGEIVFTGCTLADQTATAITEGYTILQQAPGDTNVLGIAVAWKRQTPAAATNPTWTKVGTGSSQVATIVSMKAAVATPSVEDEQPILMRMGGLKTLPRPKGRTW